MITRQRRYDGSAKRRACLTLLMVAGLAMVPLAAEARSNGHPGNGYGLAGSNPDLALGNVFSGIYGLGYTYDREHYDFHGCARSPTSSGGDVPTVRRCSYPALID